MRRRIVWSSLIAACLAGCGPEQGGMDTPKPAAGGGGGGPAAAPVTPPSGETKTPEATPPAATETPPATSETTPAAAPATGDASGLTPVPLEAGVAKLTPDNTRIEFIGTHVGEKPDPRIGTFESFSGTVEVDPATKALKAISMQINPDSLKTQFDPLTAHLKNPDFLETSEYPELKFQSASVEPGAAPDQFVVKGDLTLHGATRPIAIPTTVSVTDAGVTLKSEFTIDRTEFGMDFGVEKVEKTVSLKVDVGSKNVIPAPLALPGA